MDASWQVVEYQMLVHVFGATSSPCCAEYALRRTALDNTADFDKKTIEAVLHDFYVDDLLSSCDSVPSAIKLATRLMELLQRGGFRLTKWASNSKQVLRTLPSAEPTPKIDLAFGELPIERALGVRWDTERDLFVFTTIPTNNPSTKRGILRTVCEVFDPLGFLAPFLFVAKSFMQELWRQKLGWDEELPDHLVGVWRSWTEELSAIADFRLPRRYATTPETVNTELHVFSDASELGFGSVAYLRTTKAELGLNIDSVTFWTDSMTTLQYIQNESTRFHTFVANRVAEIREYTEPEQWHHVPGAVNPADDCSRGLPASLLTSSHRWLRGPDFLWKDEDAWPHQKPAGEPEHDDKEMKAPAYVASTSSETEMKTLEPANFSRLSRLLRVTGWIHRFAGNCRTKSANKQCPRQKYATGPLTADELERSRLLWIRKAQADGFSDEIDRLQAGKPVLNSSNIIRLRPQLVDGYLRVGGRLKRAPVPYDSRHQLILPRVHAITKLIVADAHLRLAHSGQEHVLAHLRLSYWIVKARVLVRKVVRSCIICRRLLARPTVPMMAPLPKVRLAVSAPPFYHTGLDYFGPLYVKRGRGTEKRWVCLFTCMTTRAVHLEVAFSLDTDVFIMALRRFIARRGKPCSISCDNGSNFRGAERELRQCTPPDQERVANSMAAQGVN